jgi:hypothetical protein
LYALKSLQQETRVLSLDEKVGELVDRELGELGGVGDNVEDPVEVENHQ